MSAGLSMLTNRQKIVIETMIMRFTEKESIEYLEKHGCKISKRTLYIEKKKINDMKYERIKLMAQLTFEDQHLERLDRSELVERKLWDMYDAETDPSKKATILVKIINIQPIISAYYETTGEIYKKLKMLKENSHNDNYF